MIPEPDNKKGAFAPFHNRTVVIVNIVCTLKLPSNMQSKFQIIVPITKASAFALLFLLIVARCNFGDDGTGGTGNPDLYPEYLERMGISE